MKRVSLSSLVAVLVSLWDREVRVSFKPGKTCIQCPDVIQSPPVNSEQINWAQIFKDTSDFQNSLISRKY